MNQPMCAHVHSTGAPDTRSGHIPAPSAYSRWLDTCAAEPPTPGRRIVELLADIPFAHRRLRRGEHLFRADDPFHSLYLLNAGFAKTCYMSEDGREQVAGFHLRGDMLGLDAVVTSKHACDAIALDVCDVMAIPYESLVGRGRQNVEVLHELHRGFGIDIRNDLNHMLCMGSLAAEPRVAAFLLEMSRRFGARGFSATELQLRLTRSEIGSLLGLKMETVSRAFSHFSRTGLISVCMREIVLLDRKGLADLVAGEGPPANHAGGGAVGPVTRERA